MYRSFWVHPAQKDGGRVTSQSKRSFPIQCIEISGLIWLQCYFCHLRVFVIWPFCDLWPLNRKSDREVTVDTFWCLSKINIMPMLILPCVVLFIIWPSFWPHDRIWPHVDFLTHKFCRGCQGSSDVWVTLPCYVRCIRSSIFLFVTITLLTPVTLNGHR